jgi:hypothetical protein
MCRDYQEIKIQENVQLLGVGSIPRSMPVILMDDLVDNIKAGGKQPLCALSVGSCGMTIDIIFPSCPQSLSCILFFPHFSNFPVVFRTQKIQEL